MGTKKNQTKELHKYILGMVSVLFLFGITFPAAYWRVSKSEKFAGNPFKSLTLAYQEEKPMNQIVATAPVATPNQPNSVSEIPENLAREETETTEINDPIQIKELNQKVYDRIAQFWQAGRSLKQHLAYQVTVTQDGAIASYKPLIESAENYLPETPLPKLVNSSLTQGTKNQVKTIAKKAIGKFKVVFTRQGILQVSPWHGWKR